MTMVPSEQWPAELRKSVFASRRLNPIQVTVSPWETARERALGTEVSLPAPELGAAHEASVAWLQVTTRPSHAPTVLAGAALIARAVDDPQRVWHGEQLVALRPPAAAAIVDQLVSAGGVGYAAEALGEACAVMIDGTRLRARSRHFEAEVIEASLRLREHVSTASAEEYRSAVRSAAERIKGLQPSGRLAVALAFPFEPFARDAVIEFVTRPVAVHNEAPYAATCLDDVADLRHFPTLGSECTALTLLFQLGPEVAPHLKSPRTSIATAEALGLCGTEQAFLQLLSAASFTPHVLPFVDRAMARWPEMSMRVLERSAATRTSPDLQAIASGLLHKRRAPARDPDAEERALREAKGLPPILLAPPWLSAPATPAKRAHPKSKPSDLPAMEASIEDFDEPPPRPVKRLTFDEVRAVRFRPDFPSALLTAAIADEPGIAKKLVDALEGSFHFSLYAVLQAPDDLRRAFLRHLPTYLLRPSAEEIRTLIREEGPSVVDALVKLGSTYAGVVIDGARSVRSPRLAAAAATALATKAGRDAARRWLAAHPRAAAIGLLDTLAGKGDRAKARVAEAALRELARLGHAATLREVAALARPPLAELVAELIDQDPLSRHPVPMPELPDFADPDRFEPPELEPGAGGAPAPRLATLRLLQALSVSTLDEPYAGLMLALPAFTPRSLAALSFALFEAWRVAGQPSKEIWAYHQLAFLGGDAEARRLARYIRAWPGALVTIHPGAVGLATSTGIAVLAKMGTSVAVGELASLAQKSKPKLEALAKARLEEIAGSRGMTLRELLDTMIPDFGLDARGTREIDYGPRRLTLEIDDDLVPFVLDDRAARHAAPPKASTGDDPALVAGAAADFKAMKKDLATIFKRERARLEEAMVQQEAFAPSHPMFSHPVSSRLARRVVWRSDKGDRQPSVLFVWTEGGRPRTLGGEPYDVAPTDTLRIAHPAELAPREVEGLRALLGTARPLFPQLDRPVRALDELDDDALLVPLTGPVLTERLYGLESRGWVPKKGDSAIHSYERRIGDFTIAIAFEPGMPLAVRNLHGEQLVARALIRAPTTAPATLRDLGAVGASEVLTALAAVFSPP